MTNEELLEAARRIEGGLLAEGDPLSGDDWELMQVVRRCIESVQVRPPAGTTLTHDLPDLDTLLARLSRCDGTASDCAVLVWEECQAIATAFQKFRDALKRIADVPPYEHDWVTTDKRMAEIASRALAGGGAE